jgi:hypothetical protein
MILFSSISPKAEEYLKKELFGCFKYIGIPLDILQKMPVRDRKFYIMTHNMKMQAENANSNENTYTDGETINKFAKQEQSNKKR